MEVGGSDRRLPHRQSERMFRVEFVSFGQVRYAGLMAAARPRQLLAAEATAMHKEKIATKKYDQRRKAMFFAYEMGLSVKDIAHALAISREETLRILQEDRWMYEGLIRVREYDRQLFAKSQQRRQTGGPKSGSMRTCQKRRMRQKS